MTLIALSQYGVFAGAGVCSIAAIVRAMRSLRSRRAFVRFADRAPTDRAGARVNPYRMEARHG